MAETQDFHDELDTLAREVEQAIREFDAALERHATVRQRAHEPVFRSESADFDDVQDLFFNRGRLSLGRLFYGFASHDGRQNCADRELNRTHSAHFARFAP